MASRGRVLSIQSHVVHGYVGNKCSVFTLQLLGFDVDPVNSVQFSNHTGYASFEGSVLQGSELAILAQGLESNNLLTGYTHMLTGYIGSPSFLHAVIDLYFRLKEVNPQMLFICDPVLGDDGRLYVPAENVILYREEVLPLATMITPNQFEAELLSGVTIVTEADAVHACEVLHSRGPDTVVITSNRLADSALSTGSGENGTNGDGIDHNIVLVASTRRRRRVHSAEVEQQQEHTDTASSNTPTPSSSNPPPPTSPSTTAPSTSNMPSAAAATRAPPEEAEVGGGGSFGHGHQASGGDSGGGGNSDGNDTPGRSGLRRANTSGTATAAVNGNGNNGGDAGAGGWLRGAGGAGHEAGAEAGGGGVDMGGGDGGGGGGDGGGGIGGRGGGGIGGEAGEGGGRAGGGGEAGGGGGAIGGEGAGAGDTGPGLDDGGFEEGFDVYRMTFPRIPQHFTGTGDLAAALLLAWTHRLPGDFAGALERVAGTMRAVLTRTHSQGSREILLVQSKEDIERGPLELRATAIATGR